MKTSQKKGKAALKKILQKLKRLYPATRCFLKYETPFQLLAAVQLSAQCTDEQVNKVTPKLFEAYPDAFSLARAPLSRIEKLIHATGFFRSKAKNLKAAAQKISDDYSGNVPLTLEELIRLPGVGRKTANVVMGELTGRSEGVVVDTHVKRLSQRLGLTCHDSPEKIEQDLMRVLPKEEWVSFPHRLIQHGRKICTARAPRCGICPLAAFCPSAFLKH